MYAIKTEKLTKYYGTTRGIADLDLQVERGAFFGFIGPNGAGKSTTIRALLGLIRPTSGAASVLGLDAWADRTAIARRVGHLPAEGEFYPELRVREVLKLSADLRGMDLRAAGADLCDRLLLDRDRKVSELSLGNRKKVGIVCALQHDPELLILDEPTAGLDPLMQKAFFDILKERCAAGATVFLSTHVLSEVRRYCDRAAILREGRLLASGRVEELSRTDARRVAVRGSLDLAGLAGVRDLQTGAEGCSFLYSGPMEALLRTLSAGRVEDLSVSEPDLEELFLHYYTQEGGAK